jgi:hypothetical protein
MYSNMRKLTLVSVVVLLACSAVAAAKRDWQSGKTVSSDRQEVRCQQTTCVYQEFRFEGPQKTYTARESLRWRWSKEANLTVNGPVKFAVDSHERKLFAMDDDGKEHEMEIVRKELRQ